MSAAPRSFTAQIAACVLVAVLSIWTGLGTLHRLQNADSLLMVLVSIQRWTPFFWGQDRVGMLVPLLALGVRDPFDNLIVQGWITTAAAMAAPFVAARYLAGPYPRIWFAAGAAANVLLLLVASPAARFDWFVTMSQYSVALVLAFGALIALDRRGAFAAAAGAALLVLAHWVNVGVGVILVPLILLKNGGRFDNAVAWIAIASAIGYVFADLARAPHTPLSFSPPFDWPLGWMQLARHAAANVTRPAILAIAAAWAIGGAVLVSRRRPRDATIRAAACAASAAVLYWMVVGTFEWVRMNSYYPRYIFPSLMLFAVALGLLVAAPWQHRAALALAAAAFTMAVVFEYGIPSRGRVARELDVRLGRLTSDVLSSGAEVIGGDYWHVWPAVFHANWTLRRQGIDAAVYGLADKSTATDPFWASRRVVLAAPPHDPHLARLETQRGLRLTIFEHRPTVDLFTVDPPRP